ncbi:hypothetical protein F7725_020183 [Dissostichus mawsoni]|uniref:Uncharacterized protein n=1 Tax=Dissostichus mawsoni TaxID=36200 RepID=A0A7J5YCK5_DISMA|nr:hypothetical protein F7725_020183 [Dissostichus mawsoni]
MVNNKWFGEDKKRLPEHLRLPSVEVQYSRHLIPEEMMCQHCPGNVPLSDPMFLSTVNLAINVEPTTGTKSGKTAFTI